MIALAEKGALFDPGPCMYMEKLAVGPAVDPNAVSLDRSIAENLQAVAKALQKPIGYASVIAGWQSLVICVNMLSCKCTMCCLYNCAGLHHHLAATQTLVCCFYDMCNSAMYDGAITDMTQNTKHSVSFC